MTLPLRAGETLEAGRVIEIRFSGLPDDVEELEVLLSAEGGRVTLRLTESLEPETGSLLWTVPDLAVRDARLRLRLGRAGRETDGPQSEPFAIAGTSGGDASAYLRDGEIWAGEREAGEEEETPLPVAAMRGGPESLERGAASVPLLLPPSAPGAPGRTVRSASPAASGRALPPAAARRVASRAPLFVPPRV